MQTRTLGSLVLALLFFSAVEGGQTIPQRDPNGSPNAQAPKGTGVIRGRVTAADSGTPLRRAQVRLGGTNVRISQVANTDGDGRYDFPNLPAGRYSLTVTKSGYVTLEFGQQRPFEPGKPLDLADGQQIDKVDFTLPRGSVIAGRITDEFGEPVPGVRVQAMRYQYMPDGQR
jgi:hypothetical protein